MPATPPSKVSIKDRIKSFLLRPSLTSFFQVEVSAPTGSDGFFSPNSAGPGEGRRNLTLYCSEAVIPGSSLLTHENNDDFHGTTERLAYRRAYDDRIDLTYYVDGASHYSIRFFETWIKYIADESIDTNGTKKPSSRDQNYFYRFRFPDGEGGYREGSSLFVTKFERNYRERMVYEFVRPYPIAIQSMPISYDSAQLLKCTVSMTYLRYIVDPKPSNIPESSEPGQSNANTTPNNPFALTPEQQAQFNSSFNQNFDLGVFSPGTLTNPSFSSPSFSAPAPDPLVRQGDAIA